MDNWPWYFKISITNKIISIRKTLIIIQTLIIPCGTWLPMICETCHVILYTCGRVAILKEFNVAIPRDFLGTKFALDWGMFFSYYLSCFWINFDDTKRRECAILVKIGQVTRKILKNTCLNREQNSCVQYLKSHVVWPHWKIEIAVN